MSPAEKVKRWMDENRVNQVAASAAIPYAQGLLSYFLAGKTKAPSYDMLIGCSKMMGCRLDWLLDDKQDWPPVSETTSAGQPSLPEVDMELLQLCRRVDQTFGKGTAIRRLLGDSPSIAPA